MVAMRTEKVWCIQTLFTGFGFFALQLLTFTTELSEISQ